jgi:hypothetical protein
VLLFPSFKNAFPLKLELYIAILLPSRPHFPGFSSHIRPLFYKGLFASKKVAAEANQHKQE